MVKAVPCRVRKCTPAVPGQFHGSMRVQPSRLGQEMQPVPDLSKPLLVPRGTLGFAHQQAGATQQELALPDEEPDLRIGLHNIFLAIGARSFLLEPIWPEEDNALPR